MKTEVFRLRVSPEMKKKLMDAAKSKGLKASQFVEEILKKEILSSNEGIPSRA